MAGFILFSGGTSRIQPVLPVTLSASRQSQNVASLKNFFRRDGTSDSRLTPQALDYVADDRTLRDEEKLAGCATPRHISTKLIQKLACRHEKCLNSGHNHVEK